MVRSIDKRTLALLGIAAVLLGVAGILIARQMSDPEPSVSEQIAAAGSSVSDVACERCGAVFQMPTADYIRELGNRRGSRQGVKCRRCGAAAAWSRGVGTPNPHPPAEIAARADSLSVPELEQQLKNVGDRLSEIEADLRDPAVAGDAARAATLTVTRRELESQRAWLNQRFDELAMPR